MYGDNDFRHPQLHDVRGTRSRVHATHSDREDGFGGITYRDGVRGDTIVTITGDESRKGIERHRSHTGLRNTGMQAREMMVLENSKLKGAR